MVHHKPHAIVDVPALVGHAGEQVTLTKPPPFARNALECVRTFGTPVNLYQHYYAKLKTRLVLMNGSRCTHVWEPSDWKTRSADQKVTVILNVWADHVSTYNSDIDHAPTEPDRQLWAENLLVTTKGDRDEHLYDKMVQFEWPLLLKALQDKHSKHKTVFWTDKPGKRAAEQRPGVCAALHGDRRMQFCRRAL